MTPAGRTGKITWARLAHFRTVCILKFARWTLGAVEIRSVKGIGILFKSKSTHIQRSGSLQPTQ